MLNNGKKIVSSISSIKLCDKIYSYVKDTLNKKILYFHGEDLRVDKYDEHGFPISQKVIKSEHLSDPNTSWKDYDMVLYTGTITVGVDVSDEIFDESIHIFTGRSTQVDLFTQGLL